MTKWLLLAASLLAACVRDRPPPARGVLTVSVEQHASWVRNFNPLAPGGAERWPTLAGIYEPLIVHDPVRDEYVPWLATAWEWRDGARVLRVTTREGVRWSDGAPFSARDVAFTFELIRRHPALDRRGVWTFLAGVRAVDGRTVDFAFADVFLPGLEDLAPQPIVPEHVWSRLEDPITFANPSPVATGPFTEVRVFENQLFELGRNPYYWQPGKPAVEALRFPAFPSNERANLGLIFGEVDWAANFVPSIDRVFVARDPEHHRYWFPLTGSTIFLYANTLRPPFDEPRVRKALSMAIDRELLVEVAVYGYTRPADATALSDAYARWRRPEVAAAADWVRYDPARAGALLDEAGFPLGPDGVRAGADGRPLAFELLTVLGWSDWVRAAQVIARGLGDIGVRASVRTYDFAAWFQRVQEGRFELSIGWSIEGPTPYSFYRWLLSPGTVKPEGVPSVGNWHRHGSSEAQRLLAAFEREVDPAGQRRIVGELQELFAREAPAIPLYPGPSWAAFDTERFEGFPTAATPYADPSPNKIPACLLVLTSLRPRG